MELKVADSTVLIDLIKGRKEALELLRNNETLLTTQINMYEIIKGFYLFGISHKKIQAAIEMFENIRVLSLDDKSIMESSRIFSELSKKGQEIQDVDCLIAGIALSNGATTIITRNKKHFSRIKGLKVETY